MYRKVLKLLSWVAIGALLSCSRSMIDDPFLRLANGVSETLVFGATSAEQQIDYETNQSHCETYSSASWVEVSQPATGSLRLSVQANPEPHTRKAEVTIIAGSLQRKIYVEQAGAASTVSMLQEAYTYGPWGATYEVFVNATVQDWTLSMPENDWLKITAEPHLQRILFTLSENRAFDPRELEVRLTHSTGEIPITITQQAALKYIMPFFEWGKDYDSFDDKEKARKSVFVQGPTAATQLSDASPFYIYETGARLFPFVKYEMQDLSGRMMYRIILLPANSQVVRADEFDAYLQEQGFDVFVDADVTLTNYIKAYQNDEKKTTAVVIVKGNQAEVVFTPVVEQSQDYATLDSITLGYTAFGTARLADVKAYEEGIGGQHSPTWSAIYKRQTGANIEIFLSGPPYYSRSYVFTSRRLSQTIFFADKLEVGLYRYANLYFLTRELKDLLAREGYLLYEMDTKTSTYTYVHLDKRIALKFYYGKWNGQGVLAYNVIPIS